MIFFMFFCAKTGRKKTPAGQTTDEGSPRSLGLPVPKV
jgi:hypothetical protein